MPDCNNSSIRDSKLNLITVVNHCKGTSIFLQLAGNLQLGISTSHR